MPRVTLAEQAQMEIERMLVFGGLDCSKLYSESQLASLLNVGRTPVREALQKLEQDEMLIVYPRKGLEFIQISPEQQLQLLEVRCYIEPICIQFATRRGTPEQKKRMLELGDIMLLCSKHHNDVEQLQCLQEIHALLCKATGNPYFRHTLRRIQAFSRRFWFVNKIESDNLIGSKIHWHILRSIAFGNEKDAVCYSGQLMEHLIEATFRKITAASTLT